MRIDEVVSFIIHDKFFLEDPDEKLRQEIALAMLRDFDPRARFHGRLARFSRAQSR